MMTDTDSPGSMARLAAIGLLSSSAPIGIVIFVFIFDCVSELEQPYRRKARWLLILSGTASLLCIGGFFYYLHLDDEQVATIIDQLANEIVS